MVKRAWRAFHGNLRAALKITGIEPEDNSCSYSRVTKRVPRLPGASPLRLFGSLLLMSRGSVPSLEDLSEALPPYHEESSA